MDLIFLPVWPLAFGRPDRYLFGPGKMKGLGINTFPSYLKSRKKFADISCRPWEKAACAEESLKNNDENNF